VDLSPKKATQEPLGRRSLPKPSVRALRGLLTFGINPRSRWLTLSCPPLPCSPLKDPSLLAFDKRRHNPNDNFRSIFGIDQVPCDSQMRTILDPINPDDLRPLYTEVFHRLQRAKVLRDTPFSTAVT
jgi:hypothetical protein